MLVWDEYQVRAEQAFHKHTAGCSGGDDEIRSPWILRCVPFLLDTRVLKGMLYSGGIQPATQLTWLPVLWVKRPYPMKKKP